MHVWIPLLYHPQSIKEICRNALSYRHMVFSMRIPGAGAAGEAGDAWVPASAVFAFVLWLLAAFVGNVILTLGISGAAATGEAGDGWIAGSAKFAVILWLFTTIIGHVMPSFGITGAAAAGEAWYAGVAASAVHAVNDCHGSVFSWFNKVRFFPFQRFFSRMGLKKMAVEVSLFRSYRI